MEQFLKNRPSKSISNIVIRDPDEKEKKFRPSKRLPSFDESASLKFNHKRREEEFKQKYNLKDDVDLVLKNIRNMLEEKGKRLKSFDPQNVQYIKRFQNLNDFEKPPDYDAAVSDTESVKSGKQKQKPMRSNRKHRRESVLQQFGYESSGQADLLSQQAACDEKNKLKMKLHQDFFDTL